MQEQVLERVAPRPNVVVGVDRRCGSSAKVGIIGVHTIGEAISEGAPVFHVEGQREASDEIRKRDGVVHAPS
jgi:hypothetical protein